MRPFGGGPPAQGRLAGTDHGDARADRLAASFTHASEGSAPAEDIVTTICAVLLAEATNTGFEPLIRRDAPALRSHG